MANPKTPTRTGRSTPGRPSKLTPEAIERFCEALSIGCNYKESATYAGVEYITVNLWFRTASKIKEDMEAENRGPTDREQRYLNFVKAVEQAEDNLKVELNQVLYAAARNDPVWAEKLLRRKAPDEFRPAGIGVGVSVTPGSGAQTTETVIRIQYGDTTNLPTVVEGEADKDIISGTAIPLKPLLGDHEPD